MQYAFHLERDGDAPRERPTAARRRWWSWRRAALVVTDYFPTFLVPRQTRGLRRKVETPVVAVDSATVVPVRYHEREYPTAGLPPPAPGRAAPLPPPGCGPEPRVRRTVELPFEPTVPDARIRRWSPRATSTTRWRPVPHMPGGPRAARQRLRAVPGDGLPATRRSGRSQRRRDQRALALPPLRQHLAAGGPASRPRGRAGRAVRQVPGRAPHLARAGVQLHPFRPAAPHRRGDPRVGAGGTCAGASRTTARRSTRPRSWSRPGRRAAVERGPEGLRAGRLDAERLRMLWGKAVMQWTRTAGEALGILEHLNNKYALDGRDPSTLPQHSLGVREVRPAILSAADLRHRAIHVAQGGGEEVRCPAGDRAIQQRHGSLRRGGSATLDREIRAELRSWKLRSSRPTPVVQERHQRSRRSAPSACPTACPTRRPGCRGTPPRPLPSTARSTTRSARRTR